MTPFIHSIASSRERIVRFGAALCLSLFCSVAGAQLVDISTTPLYGGRQPHPNVVVTASVEFPTVGAAYLFAPYLAPNMYSGYFDSSKCYVYNGNTNIVMGVLPTGYFSVTGDASSDGRHECSSGSNKGFSGNFLNWATMSAIDEFRYAMTGGNRVVENGSSNGTVIERAYLPDGSVSGVPSFYDLPSNFPRHALTFSGGTGYVDGVASSRASDVLPNNLVNNGSTTYIYNCKTYMFIGTATGGNCSSPVADIGAFQVRVLVCDDTEGPVRTDLCLQYGGTGGKYKPVGQAQINAATMRFAAFGYLMDHNNVDTSFVPYFVPPGCNDGQGWNRCRYGAVLRAPMKYVGPTTYDANQTSSPNARKEVNSDGTLTADPEGTAASAGGSYSGFINYINKFGANGVYKRYDPDGEMFYEAIRYYQHIGPTDLAASGFFNNGVKGYFPLITDWADPIGSICSSNYIINIADANTWDDTYLPGNPGSPSAGVGRPSTRPVEGGLDAYTWANNIGVLESTMSSITTNDVRPGLSNIANRNTGAGNSASYAVAGAAYWANVNDVRPDLAGKQTIRTISVDVAEGSIDIHDRQLYLMGKYGGFKNVIDRPSDSFANPFWGPSAGNPLVPARTNSEWEDSPGSAYPSNYLLASSPQKLINGLRSAFAQIGSQTGNLSGAALTSANLTYGAAGAYVATFNPSKWSGSVLFDSLSVDALGNLEVSTTPIWDAGSLLTARCGTVVAASTVCTDTDASANKRVIVTTATVSGIRTAIPFTYPAISTADPLGYGAMLNTDPATHMVDTLGQTRLNYLRGYRADEDATGLGLRSRDSVMGDIINSGPVYTGPPTSAIPDTDYQPFYIANAGRTGAVYVGANDGMLHALRATDGVELFAYVPGYAYPDLNALTNPGYTHDVFVDTVPKVQEVKVGGTWKTVLLGASGNGAQGIFALDVTNPTSFGPSNVLFEFSDADDRDFGNVVATPEYAKLWVSGPPTAKVYRYFAVVTGYNKKRTTGNGRPDTSVSADTQNKGVLFLIALDHKLGTPWTLNADYYKFTFPASDATKPNALAPVTLLASKSGDLTTAYMYFGDLQGNLWKLNTSTGSPSTWTPVLGTPSAPLPIFVAQDGTGTRQPITARVELANGPFGSTLVFFGTGKFLGQTDLVVPGAIQSEYSLLDVNPSVLITRSSNLAQRTAASGACPPGVNGPCLNVTGAAFSYSGSSAKKGWYLDFPSSVALGERSITKPAVRTGLLTFTTLTLSNDLCTPGNGYVYQVNALSGLAVAGAGTTIGYASTVGIPGPPRVVDLTLTPGQAQASGEAINLKTQTTLVSGTSGNIGSFGLQTPIKVPPTQQINWREITNWNDKTSP